MMLLLPLAWAGEISATAAIDALPDSNAETDGRSRVGVHAEEGEADWSLMLDGAVQTDFADPGGTLLHIERLQVDRTGDAGRLAVGRVVKVDVRGRLRLDGLSFETQSEGDLNAGAWIGRMWFPDETIDAPSLWLVGGSVRFAPPTLGNGTRAVVVGGIEGRVEDTAPNGRAWVSAGLIGLKGARADALVEGGVGDTLGTSIRADLGGTLPLAKRVDGGLRLRWEGLEPAAASPGAVAIEEAIAPEGYGSGAVKVRGGHELRYSIEVGPTAAPDERIGGQSRASLSREFTDTVIGIEARGVLIGEAGFAGAALSASHDFGKYGTAATFGAYEMRGLDGLYGWVTEGRLSGDGSFDVLRVHAEGAVGSDRLRQLWVRGGLSLTVTAPLRKEKEG